MLSDDELGELLRAQLHALAGDITPNTKLLAQVIPERRQRFHWPLARLRVAVPAAAGLVAVLVVLLLLLGGSNPQPAFAVTVTGRSVHVTLNQLTGITGLNREFRRLALPFRAVPMTADCENHVDVNRLGIRASGAEITLERTPLPPNATVIIAAERTGNGNIAMAIGQVTGAVPSCVSSRGSGPGLP